MISLKGLLKNRWLRAIATFFVVLFSSLWFTNYFGVMAEKTYVESIISSIAIAIFYAYVVNMPREISRVWANRSAFYSFLFLLTTFGLGFVLVGYDYLDTNPDSARYMFSTLVQSEAAILAIVISLTLVGVQQTSSSYSTRIVDIFKRKNPDLWIILVVYLGTMTYTLLVLKQIGVDDFDYMNHSIAVLILGVFSFVCLIPYMWNTLDLLNPTTIMKLLSENITKKTLLSSIYEKKITQSKYSEDIDYSIMMEIREEYNFYETSDKVIIYEKDPIQPIVDIVRGSLRIHDFKTAKYGLKLIAEKTNYIFTHESMDRVYCEVLLKHLIEIYTEIGYFILKSRDVDTMVQIIFNLRAVAINAISKEIDIARISAFSATENFKNETDKLKIETLSKCIDFSLEEITRYHKEKRNKTS
ncbi:MAG: DUF2254 family protein [Methanomethylovorans sp.]|uniref:DUF2254 family protein n=1 Tax=Methanomethylovorans sp. TaxID=2758717 RepID=UPI003530B89E